MGEDLIARFLLSRICHTSDNAIYIYMATHCYEEREDKRNAPGEQEGRLNAPRSAIIKPVSFHLRENTCKELILHNHSKKNKYEYEYSSNCVIMGERVGGWWEFQY